MPPPNDKKCVERLLGTTNYLAKFVPNMSAITQPSELLKSMSYFVRTNDKKMLLTGLEVFFTLNQ